MLSHRKCLPYIQRLSQMRSISGSISLVQKSQNSITDNHYAFIIVAFASAGKSYFRKKPESNDRK